MTQTQKFSPEMHRRFLDAYERLKDETLSDPDRLAACRTVIALCTSPVPHPWGVDPLPYCQGWLEIFGRAHDLRKELLEKEKKRHAPKPCAQRGRRAGQLPQVSR